MVETVGPPFHNCDCVRKQHSIATRETVQKLRCHHNLFRINYTALPPNTQGRPWYAVAIMNTDDKRKLTSRLNALKSTGPKTPEGKNRSAANALIHGAYAQNLIAQNTASETLNRMVDDNWITSQNYLTHTEVKNLRSGQ